MILFCTLLLKEVPYDNDDIKTYTLYYTAGGHTSAHPHTLWVQSWGISSENSSQQSGTGAGSL
jgi:hypothetical protein